MTLEQDAAAVLARVQSDPLVRRLVDKAKAIGDPLVLMPVSTPADIVGEQRMAAGLLLTQPLATDRLWNLTEEPINQRQIGVTLAGAVPFWWHPKIYELLRNSPLPKHRIASDLMAFDSVWWTYRGEIPTTIIIPRLRDLTDGSERRDIRLTYDLQGRLVERRPYGLQVTHFGLVEGRPMVVIFRLDTGGLYPTDYQPGGRFARVGVDELTMILQHLSFLNSPFVEAMRLREPIANKSARRRYRLQEEPEVRVVRLRERSPDRPTGDTLDRAVNWSHRWFVRGHNRAQWYPSVQAHKVIWIAPHLKGPEDAPLKMPVYQVVR